MVRKLLMLVLSVVFLTQAGQVSAFAAGEQSINPAQGGAVGSNTVSQKLFVQEVAKALGMEAKALEGAALANTETILTRGAAAEIIIYALGLETLQDYALKTGQAFPELTGDALAMATLAVDFGFLEGNGDGSFGAEMPVTQQEADKILVRLGEIQNGGLNYLHGFYAFSSWDQREMAKEMDGVSVGWAQMEFSPEQGAYLNTTGEGGNPWKIPEGYQEAAAFFAENQVSLNLNVFLSAATEIVLADGTQSNPALAILLSQEQRKKAVDAIMQEAGKSIYHGVTIDFESMKGEALQEGFLQFLGELSARLGESQKALFVAVHPCVSNEVYYDAYDYRRIGELADRVILMAHDYQANTLSKEEMAAGFTTTPVTPYGEIYYALKCITDKETGVADKGKILLAVSVNMAGWTQKDGTIINQTALKPNYSMIQETLQNGAVSYYSPRYRNAYSVEDNGEETTTVWYENSQAIRDKAFLAGLFDIQGLSVWRIGIIPNGDKELDLDIWDTLHTLRYPEKAEK